MYEKNCIFALLKYIEHTNRTFTIYLYYSYLAYI